MQTLNRPISIAVVLLVCLASQARTELRIQSNGERLTIGHNGQELLGYQILPMQNPKGGDAFKGSNFIHPLRTPSGFSVTDFQPEDHLHHFGLWWPWKYIEVEGRKIVCWELQKGEGLIQGRRATIQDRGFIAESDYIDRTAPSAPRVVLNEETHVLLTDFTQPEANGYFLDISITHRCATEHPVEVSAYRYSGFGYRGAASWNKDTCAILTSEGKNRFDANFTRAKWVRFQGSVPNGGTAGVLLMGHRENRDHPEMLRTWDKQNNGAIFANFNPVQVKPWKLEPGRKYTRRYRLFVYDGKLNEEQAEGLWKEYKNEK